MTTVTINCSECCIDNHDNCTHCWKWIKYAAKWKPPHLRSPHAKLTWLKSLNAMSPYRKAKPKKVLITINPDTSKIELQDFIRRIHQTVYRPMFAKATWSFEQRGTLDGELGKGFHTHIVATLSKGKRPHDVRRDLHRTFVNSKNPMCGHKKHVDVRLLKTDDDVEKATNYVYGIKEENKIAKTKGDDAWREENKIDAYYLKE